MAAPAGDRRQSRTASARTSARLAALKSGSAAERRDENVGHFPCRRCPAARRESCGAPSAGGSDPGYELSSRPPWISEACSDAVPSSGCGRAATAAVRSSASSSASTRPISRMASRPSRGRLPCAARAFGLDLDPLEALVRDGNRQVGRLGDHGAVGAPARDERVGADARVLFVHDAGDDELAGVEAAALHDARARRRPSRPRRSSCPASRGRRRDRRARRDRTAASCRPRRPCRCGRTTSASGRARGRRARRPRWAGPAPPPARATARPIARMRSTSARAMAASPRGAGHERRVHRVDGDERPSADRGPDRSSAPC